MRKLGIICMLLLSMFSCKTQKELNIQTSRDYSAQWNAINEHIEKGFPDKAISETEDLIEMARDNGDEIVATQAVLQRINLKNLDQEDFMEYQLDYLQNQLSIAQEPISQSIFHYALALIYHNYWNSNSDIIPDDMNGDEEKSAQDYSELIKKHFDAALIDKTKQIKTRDINQFFVDKNYNESTSLWDFYMSEKIRLLQSNVYKQLLGEREISQVIHQEYNQLISKLKRNDQDKLALETEVQKRMYFEDAVQELRSEYPAKFEYIIDYHVALQLITDARKNQEDRTRISSLRVRSMELLESVSQVGDSIYMNNAQVQIARLKAPELRISTEQVNLPEQAILMYLNTRNVDKIYYKIYQLSQQDYLEEGREREFPFKNKPVVHESELVLPVSPFPYVDLSSETVLPPLKAGFYGIAVNTIPDFEEKSKNAPLFTGNFLVSSLTINHFYDHAKGMMILEAIDRQTGKQISNANFKVLERDYKSGQTKFVTRFEGVGNPRFSYQPDPNKSFLPYVEYGSDFYMQKDGVYHNPDRNSSHRNANILTDRAIYRPGQTLHFHGLYYENAKKSVDPKPVKNAGLSLRFFDTFGNEIGTQELKSDEFGAFHGSFDIPKSIQSGNLSIRLAENGQRVNAYKNVRVEEYKRPKFLVEVDEVDQLLRLGEKVEVKGTINSYTGVPVSNAKVVYKVYRKSWIPYFYSRYNRLYPISEPILIESGTTESELDGSFDFTFTAETPENREEVSNYNYTVEIEVTDGTGETQFAMKDFNISEQSIFIKYEKKDEGALLIQTVNSDNQPITADVRIDVYSRNTDQFFIDRYWEFPDTIDENEIASLGYRIFEKDRYYSERILSETLTVKDSMMIELRERLGTGDYRLVLNAKGSQEIEDYIDIIDFEEGAFADEELIYVVNPEDQYQPGDQFELKVGSSKKDIQVQILRYQDSNLEFEQWVNLGETYVKDIPITSKDYGGFSFQVRAYYQNRIFEKVVDVVVPYRHKKLNIKPKSIRYVAEPGSKESWMFVITDIDGNPVQAQFLSSMYDASLDQLAEHEWSWSPYPSRTGTPYFSNSGYGNQFLYTRNYQWNQVNQQMIPWLRLPDFKYIPQQFNAFIYREMAESGSIMKMQGAVVEDEASTESANSAMVASAPPPPPPVSQVRTNLAEMVFFKPALQSNSDGEVKLEFVNNEALTKWKLQNFAFTRDLKYGFQSEEIVTRKELMIQANQPRFLRSGDQIQLSAKINNLSENTQKVIAALKVYDEVSQEVLDFGLEKYQISIESDQQKEVFWSLKVPVRPGLIKLVYSVVGERHEDAEQHIVPVMPGEKFLIDSKTILLDAKSNGEVDFTEMKSGNNRSSSLMIESTGSPAWYAMRSLPYLMEQESENAEAIFNRYFANALALKILKENPLVEQFYKQWKASGDTLSSLSLNAALKKVDLSSTPWLQSAISEEETLRKLAELFDSELINNELNNAVRKLEAMQLGNGAFPWFEGGRPNFYISQYILEGIIKLEDLGIQGFSPSIKSKLFRYLASAIIEDHDDLSNRISLSLIRNIWINTRMTEKVDGSYVRLVNQAKSKLKQDWYEYDLESQNFIARIFLKEDKALSKKIVSSLLEKSFYKEQLGRFWNSNPGGVYSSWDISLQAHMIALFNEYDTYQKQIDEMKFWLISNKRTNSWSSSIATSSAIYALTLGNSSSFGQGKNIDMLVNGQKVQSNAIAGLNYQKKEFSNPALINDMHKIEFENSNDHKAWANVHYQFFQDYEDIQSTDNEYFDLAKEIYVVGINNELQNIEDHNLQLGDRIRVRLVITTDRPMQFIHVSDERPAGAEPIESESRYMWDNRLGYYKSVKDLATHFFLDSVQKGRYVIEYDMYINNKGSYNSGVAEIQNYYAPEFNDYSKSIKIKVK
ncbi:alpha-2-macroglobulin family protein [Portibacter marinus]|uniref:alpha-2-macroglobulin family protein n=1 Tax=Portibacter marinus TaxID=2898660 RepID=UPI001F333AB2|nr:alpha-2-macroglobulin family protein [Portibacter marinus]